MPYQPDFGLEDAAVALWRYRHWPAQRRALRSVLTEARAVRETQREDARDAQFELTIFMIELDNHALGGA